MLTKKEKQWLKRRVAWYEKRDAYGNKCFGPTCRNCPSYRHFEGGVPYCQEDEDAWVYDYPAQCWLISSKELILEAAQFESLVAAKLATREGCMGDLCYYFPFDDQECPKCLLKDARLAAEEAMEEVSNETYS